VTAPPASKRSSPIHPCLSRHWRIRPGRSHRGGGGADLSPGRRLSFLTAAAFFGSDSEAVWCRGPSHRSLRLDNDEGFGPLRWVGPAVAPTTLGPLVAMDQGGAEAFAAAAWRR
jgi:hypothetical protein